MEASQSSLRDCPVGVFDSGHGRHQCPSGNSCTAARRKRDLLWRYRPCTLWYQASGGGDGAVREVMDLLMARQVKAVLIACNTATSVAAATLRAELDLPIIGMEPALKPASELRHGGRILVMATPLTCACPNFRHLWPAMAKVQFRFPAQG